MKTIKIISTVLMLALFGGKAEASFRSAKLRVTGVTCSMCSNSVHKALSALDFIDKIEVDLENAVFLLSFKTGKKVEIDQIRNKVEGAGFSVGELNADFVFSKLAVKKDYHFEFEGNLYHFVNVGEQNLNECVTLKFVDKGLTSLKEFRKYQGLTSYHCIKTGRSESCCGKVANQRVYHVTL